MQQVYYLSFVIARPQAVAPKGAADSGLAMTVAYFAGTKTTFFVSKNSSV